MNFLIMSVTAGEGHNSTARAIQAELTKLGASSQILDTFNYISPELAKLISEGYLLVAEKAKKAYEIGYTLAENRKNSRPLPILNKVFSKELAEYINSDSFDAVVFTHPFAGMLTSVMKERGIISNRTLGILTDFTFHPYWEDCTGNDYVVVPDMGLLPQARAKGFSDSQILPLGIPINPAFSEKISKEEARRKLGLDTGRKTVLIMGGSMGYGNISSTVSDLDRITDYDFQLIVVCGNNAEMKDEVDKLSRSSSHTIISTGFVDYVSLLMDASDILVSKPGGLTTSEALAKGLPMIIINPIPGQEERNAEFLLNMGCAMQVSKTAPLDTCLYQLLSSDTRLNAMKECISAVGKPFSTENVCRFLTELASVPAVKTTSSGSSRDIDHDIYIDNEGFYVK